MRLLTIAAAVLLATTSAAAQDTSGQTPENAQAFLTKVVAAGGVQVHGRDTVWGANMGFGDGRGSANATSSFPRGTVLSAAAEPVVSGPPCATTLTANARYGTLKSNIAGGVSEITNPLFGHFQPDRTPNRGDENYEYAYVGGKHTIDWKTVSGVGVNGDAVSLVHGGTLRGNIQLYFPTSDLAKRVGFAMEVIRLACDSTADANF